MSLDAATRDTEHLLDRQHDAGAGDHSPRPRAPFQRPLHPPTPRARRRLAQLLVGKSVLETLLVATLAVAFYTDAFHPGFRGSLDLANAQSIEGWVVDASRPESRVEVQLYLDGRFAAGGLADEPRPDVLAAGRAADDRHGFRFRVNVTEPGEHEARVYAVHASDGGARRTLQQIGRPLRFRVQ
jgi:hypothetical protein